MENEVLKRLRKYIKSKGLTVKAFGESIGVSENTFKTMFSRDSNPNLDILIKISNEYHDFSLQWILKGEGSMSVEDDSIDKTTPQDEEYRIASEPLKEYLPTSNFKLVPLVNLDIAGGTTNQEMDIAQYVEKYIPFVDAKSEDIACPVTNNSMSPIYPPGTIVQIRKIVLWREYIEYGQVYVVDLVDGRRLIKQVKKGSEKNKFILSSFNKDYEDNEIPTEMIYSMWLVIAKYEKVVM